MMGRILIFLAIAVISATRAANPAKIASSNLHQAVKDEYLVVLKTGVATKIIDRVIEVTGNSGGHVEKIYVIGKNTILRVRGGEKMIETLASDDGVRVIEPNYLVSLERPMVEGPPQSVRTQYKAANVAGARMKTCNEDRGGTDAWGIIRTSYQPKPNFNTDAFRWGTFNDDGTGTDVYILDTGIKMDHEDFAPGTRVRWGFTASATYPLEDPYDDLDGHGTHVAGTAAGNKFGIARNANLIAVKVLPAEGSVPWSDSIEGLEWIVNDVAQLKSQGKTTRSVVNMSLGGWGPAYALETAVQATIDAGVLVVTSAGNRAVDTCTHTPQRIASIFTVSATNINDTLASFSNYGPCTDIMAPGRTIIGPSIYNTTAYVRYSGTSMACPHVVGTVARYLSVLPDSKAAKMTPELIKAKVINAATQGAIDLWSLEYATTPNRLLYKVCEDGEVDPPMTTTTQRTSTEVTTDSPRGTTVLEEESSTASVSAITMERINSMATAALSLTAVTLSGSFCTMVFLYCATSAKRK